MVKVGKKDDREKIPQYKANSTKTNMQVLIDRNEGADKFAMRVVSIEPGGQIGLHNHPYEHEIYVLAGVGEVRTENQTEILEPGRFCFIPPDESHSFVNKGETTLEFICCIPKRPGMENVGS